ncbi:MAG: acetoacetate decarboxylase family protein [Candidatus Microthrix sp.]|nr:acetoacetate decarboxylase family protein [Candidatus Microthrix sp.]MBK9559881.1 acetoacetate decarboxylase family protein [Candidatus Microthrix sp.]
MAERVTWGTIQDQPITFPMNVDDFNAATMGFSVPAAAAAALLPGDGFEIIEIAPGVAQFIISLCDYRDNPWGAYNEVNLGLLARPQGAGDEVIGSFIYRMPVDQAFTCEAGNLVMGFPKVVTRIDADYTDAQVTFQLFDGGELALSVTVPRVRSDDTAVRVETTSYSYLDGVPHGTPLAMDMSAAVIEPGDVHLTIGSGPIADELTSLGLATEPDFCSWGEHLTATFQLGTPL